MDPNFELQDRFLERFFAKAQSRHFYLTGGTALARFYYHHRESIDLDLFTNDQKQDFDQLNRVVLTIWKVLNLQIASQVTTDTYIQYIVSEPSGTSLKVDFVKDIPIHFGELLVIGTIQVDSLENIGSNKILSIFGRTDAKDFIDLYWILHRTKLKIDLLYHQAQEKDLGLSELYLAYAMQNIDQIRLFPRMLAPLPWDDIREFYHQLARDLIMRIRPD